MVEAVDRNVGKVLRELEENKLREKTLIIFTSDNGGLSRKSGDHYGPTDNTPLRNGKGTLYEGGIRVPAIINWKGIIKPGESEAIITSTDYFPTIMDFLGIDYSDTDGVSLVSHLTESNQLKINTIKNVH